MINNPPADPLLLACLANNGGISHLILFIQAKNNLLERFNELSCSCVTGGEL